VRGPYPAPYETYRQLREAEAAPVIEAAKPAESKALSRRSEARPTGPRRLTWKEQRELESLEVRIEELEAQKAALQVEINASSSDYVRLGELADQLRGAEAEADAASERWLELAELTLLPPDTR